MPYLGYLLGTLLGVAFLVRFPFLLFQGIGRGDVQDGGDVG